MASGWKRPSRRLPRWWPLAPLAVSVAVLITGCSVLTFAEDVPSDITRTTSAAAAATNASGEESAITVPTLRTGDSSGADPTPWASQLTTEVPTTTSEAPLTAPTTTRLTLTFRTFTSVTEPTVSAPTAVHSPPPDCFTAGTCKAIDSATSGGATVDIVNPPDSKNTVAVLRSGSGPVDAVSLARLGSPSVACTGKYCLVQGTSSGTHFGSLVTVSGNKLDAVAGTSSSASALRLTGSASSPIVAGTQRFGDYGLIGSDAPVAARTWAISGGKLASTGCSAPRLYVKPPAVDSAQSGTCSGTPKIAGYGNASAHKILRIGGFVTPSGNIHCALVSGGDQLACTAKQHSFSVKTCTKPVKDVPKNLRGLRVLLGKSGGMAHDGCLGYTLVGSPKSTIQYNRLAAGNGFVCEVQESGVTCTGPSGKGFVLSRSSLSAT